MNPIHLPQSDTRYPASLRQYLGDRAPNTLAALGKLDILQSDALALFCSVKCPGSLILQTYDLAQALRQAGVTVISGFHSPIERECLRILLRGTQPITLCLARSIERLRIRAEYKQPLEDGRLLILSPFVEKTLRPTVQTALHRNYVVAALAKYLFIAYAEPTGKMEEFCREVLAWGKPIYTFKSEATANLIALGAIPLTPDSLFEKVPGLVDKAT